MKKQVIVVGAGLAGLAAAYEISKSSKHQVTLLEATDQIGGRVKDVKINGQPVDFGGFMIFPWYKNYLRYCKELGIDKDIIDTPELPIFYKLGKKIVTLKEYSISKISFLKMGLQFFPHMLFMGSADAPNVRFFGNDTVEQYIKKLEPNPKMSKKFLKLMDVVSQGYCYAPLNEYQAAFAIPIYPNTLFKGDASDCQIFKSGSSTLPNALAKAIKANGGKIVLNCKVTSHKKGSVKTSKGTKEADKIIFAQPAKKDIKYTKFVTAAFESSEIFEAKKKWGAVFFPAKKKSAQVLSIINLEKLYKSKKLKNHYIVNIKVSSTRKPTKAAVQKAIKEIFADNPKVTIKHQEYWEAMPISTTSYVKKVQELQGKNKLYYAGDYLGCPSMETALASGIRAAEECI